MPKGVKIEELKIGEGQVALRNTAVRVRYDGFLSRGDVFQKAIETTFDLSHRRVIAGLMYGDIPFLFLWRVNKITKMRGTSMLNAMSLAYKLRCSMKGEI